MLPPESAAKRLLTDCQMPPKMVLNRIVESYLQRKNEPDEIPSLCFEVEHAFEKLSENNFKHPPAGARAVIALLRGLTWRRYATLVQKQEGRLQPSSCQWFMGVRGQGSFCVKEQSKEKLTEPKTCLKKACFAPFVTSSYASVDELEETGGPSAMTEGSLEQKQIQLKLGEFIEKSPILGDLFCQWMKSDENAQVHLKKRWSERFGVSIRSIENWRHRAATLFMSIYTGAFERLKEYDASLASIVALRDFHREYTIPSQLLSLGKIALQLSMERVQVKQAYQKGWYWMQDWMAQNGYPEAKHLQLPFREN